MPETETVIGTIKKLTEYEGRATGVTLEGVDGYFNYSKSEYRAEPWDDHKAGDEVMLGVQKSGDKTYIKAIKVTARASENGAAPLRSGSDYRTHEQINRTNALNAAVQALSTHINPDYDQEAYLSTIEALALRWAGLIENGEV